MGTMVDDLKDAARRAVDRVNARQPAGQRYQYPYDVDVWFDFPSESWIARVGDPAFDADDANSPVGAFDRVGSRP